MKNLKSFIKLNKEAYLLDSKLYILKGLLAVAATYFVASKHPIASKDMISVLFGLMLTLEPATLTGIKNGWGQVYASLLGGISTAIIISLFGINIYTISLSMAFTLYVCLKINWREVSPVAIFTSIYMTQYVQLNSMGEPSALLTMRLRFMALGVGVFMAILFNFIFAFMFYKKIEFKRATFILKSIRNVLVNIYDGIENKSDEKLFDAKTTLPSIFNNIDWTYMLLMDIKFEEKIKKSINKNFKMKNAYFVDILDTTRNMCHMVYDICDKSLRDKESDTAEILKGIKQVVESLETLENAIEKNDRGPISKIRFDLKEGVDKREEEDIEAIKVYILKIRQTIMDNGLLRES